MSTSNQLRVSLFFLVFACLNISQDLQAQAINVASIEIHNDLPPGSQFYFISVFQRDKYLLQPGQTYTKVINLDAQDCRMVYDNVCAKLFLYDPKIDLGHNSVFWSVRRDGVYKSWDNNNWDKKTGWGKIC
ncbi:hypothetical protein Lal_00021926 [Lupinus albus]|uniref:Uncharacterized protein n=1 Tax=Lupinus albus TaxID=3870 RepID=A0A6A5LXD0_LUPAL|nr:hypothetical protein Lalb_Chr23g0276871 [Lupinus albus]KAF1864503.1 hypothetical protein Lal_00021926 [Lupinus albus]